MSNGPAKKGQPPPNIDADRLIKLILNEVDIAARGWRDGDPQDEMAFMNRLTERLKRKRRKCDVGESSPMKAESTTYVLHRKGINQKDKYGADLAVTLDVEGGWRKTAIFQLKKCKGYELNLDLDDLMGAKEDSLIATRSFVMAIDEDRLGIRLEKVETLLKEFNHKQKSKTFDANSWTYLNDWLSRWLRCELSLPSPIDDSPSVEGLLEAFRKKPIEVDEDYPLDRKSVV